MQPFPAMPLVSCWFCLSWCFVLQDAPHRYLAFTVFLYSCISCEQSDAAGSTHTSSDFLLPQLDLIKPQDLLPVISQEAQVEENHRDEKDKF